MTFEQTREYVIEWAAAHLEREDISVVRCLGAKRLARAQNRLWSFLFRENPTEIVRLWRVEFEKRLLPPGILDFSNTVSVFVEEESGACGVLKSAFL